jgi:predicted transcriptional regulator
MANTTSLKLPEDLKEKVGTLAHDVAQTPHAYMVEAIAEKVARDEKRQAFLKEGHGSVADFKRSGAAYPHKDVMRYFLKKATGKKAARPKALRIRPAER